MDLREADALALPLPDACFDTVVCTFSLCAIPDERGAVSEMSRVLRPGRLLLRADHIGWATWPVRAIQRILEVFTVPLQGEHYLRRPLHAVQAEGFTIGRRERFRLGSPNGSPPANPPLASSRTGTGRGSAGGAGGAGWAGL